MNLVFVMGKIIEKIDFKFIYKAKDISIAKTKMQLNNDSTIEIVGYNEMADFMYRKLNAQDRVFVYGELNVSIKGNLHIKVLDLFIETGVWEIRGLLINVLIIMQKYIVR